MIYLILEILVYLALALGLGAATGWLWRNLEAARREEELQRALAEARESLARISPDLGHREAEVEQLRRELDAREQDTLRQAEALARQERRLAELEAGREALGERLGEAREAAVGGEAARQALEAALAEVREELDQVRRDRLAEQRRVDELVRERELQNQALRALEQQLELAREHAASRPTSRAANA